MMKQAESLVFDISAKKSSDCSYFDTKTLKSDDKSYFDTFSVKIKWAAVDRWVREKIDFFSDFKMESLQQRDNSCFDELDTLISGESGIFGIIFFLNIFMD